jgi:hypothetical protein
MSYAMSYTGKGIIGAVALTLGAAQFAPGHGLTGSFQAVAAIADQGVNRTAKADRAAGAVSPAAPTQTISIRLDGLADTSVLVRLPQGARRSRPESLLSKPGRPPIGCDPVVSVLTDIVTRLQPGRCIT